MFRRFRTILSSDGKTIAVEPCENDVNGTGSGHL